ncbi:ADP-ribosyl-(dinitrogen reductase) hydrolase [Xanthomonas graminis]|uniref:ADP-ribosyl-(dinitrogen reductase) hydrolase n=1 Tax=Xanthomonas graminis TaxID=3390026 RepID=UPI0011874BFE|nr:ADP-ribosyl-(dinitrogen reductase) hydrolase [Xanthomonas translucens]UKE66268.1 hypothetical protein KM547_02745 [Xanthomonas translucens pv. phlei]
MAIIIPPGIAAKIGRPDHGKVTEQEVRECFENHDGRLCWDSRPEHLDGEGRPSPWFVAETNQRRYLKIMFVRDGNDIYLKSAYPATETVRGIYERKSV